MSIAVVDLPVEDRVVVWHVSVGDGLDSTMAGAWVLPIDDERVDRLIAGRLLVTTDAAVDRFGAGADARALAASVQGEVDALDRAFTAHLGTLPVVPSKARQTALASYPGDRYSDRRRGPGGVWGAGPRTMGLRSPGCLERDRRPSSGAAVSRGARG
jgi:hypothetical protein